jgi:hypothetical protein
MIYIWVEHKDPSQLVCDIKLPLVLHEESGRYCILLLP